MSQRMRFQRTTVHLGASRMKVISADSNNDIYIGPDGNLATATELQAVIQAAEQAVKTQLGEMIFAVDQGLPNFSAIWNGAPNTAQFEAYLRQTLLAVEHVIGIQEVSITVANNVLSYTATIETDYGQGALNG